MLNKFTVPQLKDVLGILNLRSTGLKSSLQLKLQNLLISGNKEVAYAIKKIHSNM